MRAESRLLKTNDENEFFMNKTNLNIVLTNLKTQKKIS